MTDKELLKLAAKAVGIKLSWHDNHAWNPLNDDGDALRLAEKLGLTICMDGTGTVSACDNLDRYNIFVTQSIQECGSRIAATRRAIVRAAAEIGKLEVRRHSA